MSWPELPDSNENYTDEFGVIAPEVYRAAGELWPRANRFSLDQLGDSANGQRLLFRAVAQVSRHILNNSEPVLDLKAYLWRSFERLVFEERRRVQRQHSADDEFDTLPNAQSDKVDDRILWNEILQQMEPQTRQLFRLRALGYKYEEISMMLGKSANVLRSQFDKTAKKIKKKFNP
ncbi:MAG: sigma-70 family RNA polymerase sigma factor [Acidobacteria bacterium]|nr:sigma-70 family RNA polymerase sigma factor [Acidobacteriota bacterium]